jgi:hypothetical protein
MRISYLGIGKGPEGERGGGWRRLIFTMIASLPPKERENRTFSFLQS